MPAIDKCEESIIKALEKEGWKVIDQPYSLKVEEGFVYADLRLKNHAGEVIIVVEVKCFAVKKRWLDDFYGAIGQYGYYELLLGDFQKPHELFLAVPQKAYEEFFQKESIKRKVKRDKIKMIVVDLELEEVTLWIS
jgi:hypothetical protein